MIISFSIRDFVLVSKLDLEPANGFTALTGQTGAGKSIILDALGCALGGKADKRFVRAGAKQASVAVEFAAPPSHLVWDILETAGIEADPSETLTLRRTIPASGAARAFLNDRPASATLLSEIGEALVEVHGQHASSALTRPSCHRALLDQFGGAGDLVSACADTWNTLVNARSIRKQLETDEVSARANLEWLTATVETLNKLCPEEGEAATLTAERTYLMQSERIGASISEARDALRIAKVEAAMTKASRAIERVRMTPGLTEADKALSDAATNIGDALERAIIELTESISGLAVLSNSVEQDTSRLEQTEGRLFALRAEARKHNVQVDDLPRVHRGFVAQLERIKVSNEELRKAREKEKAAAATWRNAASALTQARKAAAKRLEKAALKELKPLKLGDVRLQISVAALPDDEQGSGGADHVEFEVETNPGAGFGPLRKIASGGELARFSLALKCALAETSGATTLIFDEVDAGVGGAVAAAIGERLSRLATKRAQVMAITHSPQVAAAANDQWLVEKSQGRGRTLGRTQITALNSKNRTEEIARMLSGASITNEARAAAIRLLAET